MKYIATVFCVISVGVIGVAIASEVTFVWDANVESDLAGYKIHYGTATGVYTQVIDIGSEEAAAGRNPACSVPYNPSDSVCCEYTIELDSGTYFFAATAYDDEGNESDPSAELTHTFYSYLLLNIIKYQRPIKNFAGNRTMTRLTDGQYG
jgi:hypothetical protein